MWDNQTHPGKSKGSFHAAEKRKKRQRKIAAPVGERGKAAMEKIRSLWEKVKRFRREHPLWTLMLCCAAAAVLVTAVYFFVSRIDNPQYKNDQADSRYVEENGQVQFQDAAFERAVRRYLHRSSGKIYALELMDLSELYIAGDASLKDIADLRYFTSLEKLTITGTGVEDISVLQGLPLLAQVNLSYNHIESMEALKNHQNLSVLHLQGNRISDPSPLSALERLEMVDLSHNNISAMRESMGRLERLRECDVSFNRLSSIDAFSGMEHLEILRASNNKITSVQPLEKMRSLRKLSLGGNAIARLESLGEVPALEEIDLSQNLLSDLEFAPACPNVRILNIGFNDIADLTPLSQCAALEALHLEGTKVQDLTPLHRLENFSSIFLDPGFDRSKIDFLAAHFANGDFETKKYIIGQKHDLLQEK